MVMSRTQTERLANNKERVRDGLMYSEFIFRKSDTLMLMKEEADLTEVFEMADPRGVRSGLAYSDSTILIENDPSQQAWNRTIIFDEQMTYADDQVQLKK